MVSYLYLYLYYLVGLVLSYYCLFSLSRNKYDDDDPMPFTVAEYNKTYTGGECVVS